MNSASAAGNLSNGAKTALIEASQSKYYNVQVLSQTTQHGLKYVVLLGERHIKNKSESDLGIRIIDEFNLIATEGTEENDSDMIDSKFEKLLPIIYFFDHLLSFNLNSPFPSTILEVEKRYVEGIPRDSNSLSILQILYAHEKNDEEVKANISRLWSNVELLKELKTLFNIPEEITEFPENIDDYLIRAREEIFRDRLENVGIETMDPEPVEMRQVKNRTLKAVQTITVCTGFALTGACTLVFGRYLSVPVKTTLLTSSVTGILGSFTYFSGMLNPILPETFKFPEDNKKEVRAKRDQIMAKRISKIFNFRPYAESLLVIVGRNHVPGIFQLLQSEFGFSAVPLNEI